MVAPYGLQIVEKRMLAERALMSSANITKDQAFDVFLSIAENKIPYLRFFDQEEAVAENKQND